MRARRYDGRVSRPEEVEVAILGTTRANATLQVVAADGSLNTHALSAVRVEDRIGIAPRIVLLPGDASLEIVDNEACDAALTRLGIGAHDRTMRWLERRWPVAVAALVLTGAATWGFVRFGVPALAERAATLIPPSAEAYLEAGGLALLDQRFFRPTQLPASRQQVLRAGLNRVSQLLGVGRQVRLEFRGGGPVGPNAFALPAGTIVMTDELVGLARHDDELLAVLAHEVGHVKGRHALRMLLQSSTTTLLAVALLGDLSAISSTAAAVPATLVQTSYSRAFEREADAQAYRWMALAGVPPHRLRDLLLRVEALPGNGADWGYLSTHPPSRER